jgi:hypothetical protein
MVDHLVRPQWSPGSGITGPKYTAIMHLAHSPGILVFEACIDATDPLHETESIRSL